MLHEMTLSELLSEREVIRAMSKGRRRDMRLASVNYWIRVARAEV